MRNGSPPSAPAPFPLGDAVKASAVPDGRGTFKVLTRWGGVTHSTDGGMSWKEAKAVREAVFERTRNLRTDPRQEGGGKRSFLQRLFGR